MMDLGIGMRVSLHPHCDDFVPVIVGALDEARRAPGVGRAAVHTEAVSTYVGTSGQGAERALATFLVTLVRAATGRSGGGHVVAQALFSRGCPGEVCGAAESGDPTAPGPVVLSPTGVAAVADWAVYPLQDPATSPGARGHMDLIERAVESARARGTASASPHYVTRLEGDLSEVVATAVDGWAALGAEVRHVVSHLTVSVASPTTGERR